MRNTFLVMSINLLVASLLAGCGSTEDKCVDVSGDWTIDAHCVPALQGQAFAITQTECSFTLSAPFAGWQGTISSSGEFSVAGLSGEQQYNCTGTAKDNTISGSCTPTCDFGYSKVPKE